MKINYRLLPVKAHYFFFMAASGPILPYLTVYGKQLGISEVIMGSITAVLPLLFLLAKPVFGFIVDYFQQHRKVVFMVLVCSMSAFYILLYFVPPIQHQLPQLSFNNTRPCLPQELAAAALCEEDDMIKVRCHVECDGGAECDLEGVASWNRSSLCSNSEDSCAQQQQGSCNGTCQALTLDIDDCFYHTFSFYGFVVLMSLSMISYNVANSVSDAICFDMLGDGAEMNYGKQRVWGAIGFGLTALLGGVGMDMWSGGGVKNYTPAFVMVLVFTFVDMLCCMRLQLPKLGMPPNILKEMGKVLNNRNIIIFLLFATLAGVLDSFIIYFMFWYLEDVAMATGHMDNIKLLEGLTVAAETLGAEVIFFPLSGKILQKIGYGHALSVCFFNYAVRLGLISLIRNPWWLVPVELFMQGPTFALCYTTIVAYASAISPPGTSATMQGLVAGMDDGFGYAIGSLIGGFLYKAVGGKIAFQMFSATALVCCLGHFILYKFVLSKQHTNSTGVNSTYLSPGAAIQMTQVAQTQEDKSDSV